MQASVAETAALLGDRPHALPNAGIISPGRLISRGHAAAADGFTRPSFAHPVGTHEMRDSFPLGRGHHHFFPNRSFSAALCLLALGRRTDATPVLRQARDIFAGLEAAPALAEVDALLGDQPAAARAAK